MGKTAKRLFGPLQVSNAVTTRYTVPASTKTILRHIHIQNPSVSAVTFTLSVGTDATATRLFDAYSIPGAAAGVTGSVIDWYGYIVLDAAEIIQTNAGTTNVLVVTGFGDEYVL